MLSRVTSAAIHGIDGYPVSVEVDYRQGLPSFSIVGLPDTGVKESRERVLAAIKNSALTFPPQRITVNLAPGYIKKEGPSFDLPIAVGILIATEILPSDLADGLAFLGELGLNAALRPVRGVLPCVLGLKKRGIRKIVLPRKNAQEAAIVDGVDVFPLESLTDVIGLLTQESPRAPYRVDRETVFKRSCAYSVDFADVKGQSFAKRALEVAAAGGHNILLIGPPGSGKTLLARRIPTILPDMEFEEALETTKIHSVAGYLRDGESLMATRPFRSPHHQVSNAALVGGGANPRPGEVSLAHRGVLFLDELPEFGRDVLEGLRQPLEDRFVTVVRVANAVRYPADFLLVAAANPCPCGYAGSSVRACACTPAAVQRYHSRLSGPLLDRVDLHVEVPALKLDEITELAPAGESSESIRRRVVAARTRQRERLRQQGLFENSQMGVRDIRRYCAVEGEGRALLKEAIKKLGLSARAYDRILKVARTIADLDDSASIGAAHISEAVAYRVLDRGGDPAAVSM